MAKKKGQRLNTSDLIRRIAKSSGYNIYEVEDVIEHMLAHIQKHLRENAEGQIALAGVGVIHHVMKKPRTFYSGLAKAVKTYYNPSHQLSFKLSKELTKMLKEAHDEQYLRDNGLPSGEPSEGSGEPSSVSTT